MHASCSSHPNSRFAYSDTSHWAKRKNCDSFKFLRIPLTFSILDTKILFGTSLTNIHKITCIVTAWRTKDLPTTCFKCEPGEEFLHSSLCYDIIILVGRGLTPRLKVLTLLQALGPTHHATRNHIPEYNNLNPQSTLFTWHWKKFSHPYEPKCNFNVRDKTTKVLSYTER